MLLLLLAYLHVDVPLDLEGLGTFFTGFLHALSTNGLTEVDTDPLHGVWKSIHKVTAIGTLLCRLWHIQNLFSRSFEIGKSSYWSLQLL